MDTNVLYLPEFLFFFSFLLFLFFLNKYIYIYKDLFLVKCELCKNVTTG